MARILLGVSGSIAAYKAVDLCSRLVQRGHEVVPVLTISAQKFVQPLSFSYVCRHNAVAPHFSEQMDLSQDHIALADWTEVFLIAPATANIMGKLAGAIADDALSTLALAVDLQRPHFLAPAMNHRMFAHPLVQKNIEILRELGYEILEPQEGHLACGHQGPGRMMEPQDMVQRIEMMLSQKK